MDDGVLRTRGCRRHAGSPTDFKLPPVRRSRTRDCCTEQPHALLPNPLPLHLIKFANRIQYKQVLLSSKVSGTYLGIGCQNDIVKWNIMTCNIMTNSEGKGLAGDKEKSGRLLQRELINADESVLHIFRITIQIFLGRSNSPSSSKKPR